VREHSFADGKGRSQVLAEELLLGVLLQGADQLTVDLDLILLSLFRDDVGGLFLFEDFAFSMADLLGLGATEVIVVQSFGHVDSGNINLSLGGDDVDLVDSPERASVDAERAGDQQKPGSQLFQKDDALSLVNAGQQDQNGARSDGGTKLAVMLTKWLLVGGLPLLAGLRGQSARHFVELDDALIAVLLTADLFGHGRCLLDHRGFSGGLVLDEGGLLVVHLGSGEPHDPAVDLHVSRRVSHS